MIDCVRLALLRSGRDVCGIITLSRSSNNNKYKVPCMIPQVADTRRTGSIFFMYLLSARVQFAILPLLLAVFVFL